MERNVFYLGKGIEIELKNKTSKKSQRTKFIWEKWSHWLYQIISRHPNFWLSVLVRRAAINWYPIMPQIYIALLLHSAHVTYYVETFSQYTAWSKPIENRNPHSQIDGIGYVMHGHFHCSIHFNCILNGNQFLVNACKMAQQQKQYANLLELIVNTCVSKFQFANK